MFEVINTPLAGLKVIVSKSAEDVRGEFHKLFSAEEFAKLGLNAEIKEFFYSINRKDVIRGMHFQTPPAQHTKIVYVSAGSITDVVVDIRKGSVTYGKYFAAELNGKDGKYLYIPAGFAHGFASKEDGTVVHYAQSSSYNKECDCGIAFDSFGYDWGVKNPIMSDRDKRHCALGDYDSPFCC